MDYTFSNTWNAYTKEIIGFIKNFKDEGKLFGDGDRNVIKLFEINNAVVNVKSFKIPNLINQIAYRFFRKSKAQRSFEYAQHLEKLNIGTPKPIAYFEESTLLFFKSSYYVSEHLDCDLTYRELTRDLNFPHHEEILRAFTRFTYQLHEHNVLFLDHSPGNTLIKLNDGDYQFYLVDLNRMNFKSLSLEERIKNFARLTIHKEMVKVMSDEYAKCVGENKNKIFEMMWSDTQKFQEKFYRKRRLKKKIKFWKK
ncbi:lipopolysaccharide kinase (Kdo/WaaP) family protein [Mesonia algae]|uniref:Lipopolysaccharide kinase (Kdo/WaaP) family protein n=1 Tax=Mesonia algae TaxID=213248 RepID=A0A2W7I4Z7_9FLAO|nr:lipopolysaccharide kinase InaA family protein [Mesonia algae]PZW40542.1 lipopolysaccharide kinase (Kdo/WaaP) family protein [Mesonia algae]